MTLTITDLLPPLHPGERDALSASIRAWGVVTPIVVDQHGTVLDGHHRKAITTELGLACPVVERHCKNNGERLAVGLVSNEHRRQRMTREERDAAIAKLRSDGYSGRWISDILGVNEKTVRNSTAENSAVESEPAKAKSRDGRRRPERMPTPTERDRRAKLVAQLYQEGYHRKDIREALDIGDGTFTADLRAAGVAVPPRGTHRPGSKPPGQPLAKIEWRDKPKPANQNVIRLVPKETDCERDEYRADMLLGEVETDVDNLATYRLNSVQLDRLSAIAERIQSILGRRISREAGSPR